MSAIRLVLGCRSNQWKECRLGPRAMCIAAELRAVDLSSNHQFEEEIGDSSSENRLFITKMEFSVRTGRTNTFLIRHGVEGNWFCSSSAWEKLMRPLIEKLFFAKTRSPLVLITWGMGCNV